MSSAIAEQRTEPNMGLLPGRAITAIARVITHYQHRRGDGWRALGKTYHLQHMDDHRDHLTGPLSAVSSDEDHAVHMAVRALMYLELALEERDAHATDTAPAEEDAA